MITDEQRREIREIMEQARSHMEMQDHLNESEFLTDDTKTRSVRVCEWAIDYDIDRIVGVVLNVRS